MRETDLKVRGHTNAITEIQGTINKALIGLKGGGRWKETKRENSFGTNIIRNKSGGKPEEHVPGPGETQSGTLLETPPVPPVPMARSHGAGPLLPPLPGLQRLRGVNCLPERRSSRRVAWEDARGPVGSTSPCGALCSSRTSIYSKTHGGRGAICSRLEGAGGFMNPPVWR